MPAQVTNYQCPSCTGPLHFVGASGKLECDYCGASYEVAEIEALYAEKEEKAAAAQQAAEEKDAENKETSAAEDWDTSGLTDDWGAEADGMKSYSCPAAARSWSATRARQRPPAPTAATPRSYRGSFRGC